MFIDQKSVSLCKFFSIWHPHFLHLQSVKKEKNRCVLIAAVLVSYFYAIHNRCLIWEFLLKIIIFFLEISVIAHNCYPP